MKRTKISKFKTFLDRENQYRMSLFGVEVVHWAESDCVLP